MDVVLVEIDRTVAIQEDCANRHVGALLGDILACGLFQRNSGSHHIAAWLGMTVEFNFTPELHLSDGRIIRNIEDASAFAREHEPRPGVDTRDEVLHALERAQNREQAHAAAHLFLRWLEELELVT
jgi:hypothetical protein